MRQWWTSLTLADGTVCAPQSCTFSWSAFVAAYPNATISGGFGVNQGSGSGGLIAATFVDATGVFSISGGVSLGLQPDR
mgnify:CR=1 FL=1